MSIREYLIRQRGWSERTFGPGKRTLGICAHIIKELEEIKADPNDAFEWLDVIILGLDGYWRAGGSPETLMAELMAKQWTNRRRKWPPIQPEDMPTEHIRESSHNPMINS